MEYVTSVDKTPGCVLCNARDGVEESRPLLVHASGLNIVLMNLYPYNSGHVMVAPKRHVASLSETTSEELADMMALTRRLEGALREVYQPDGINLGMNLGRPAGAGIPDHLHLHLVPRWSGDTSFMTVTGETRVIPEEPAAGCLKLRPFFAE